MTRQRLQWIGGVLGLVAGALVVGVWVIAYNSSHNLTGNEIAPRAIALVMAIGGAVGFVVFALAFGGLFADEARGADDRPRS